MRKTSCVVFMFLLLIKILSAAYDVEVKLIHYHRNKDCCDNSWLGCSDCDVYFKVCVLGSQCLGGNSYSRVENGNDFYFSQYPFIMNSFVFGFSSWKNPLKVAIETFDFDSIGADDSFGNVSYEYTGPPVNISLAKSTTGSKNLSLQLSITTTCVPERNFECDSRGQMICKRNYYGPVCDTYCKADGHKQCTSRGELQCQPQYYGPNCGIHCFPVSHNQLCTSNGTKICKESFYGPACEKYCVESENIVCDANGDRRCKTGRDCEADDNVCLSPPCIHGTCTSNFNGSTCKCNAGYTGVRCDAKIDECGSLPCAYGTCFNTEGGYLCQCGDGFSGKHCDENIDDCANAPCLNGNCVDGINMFECLCNTGFTGRTCDVDVIGCNVRPCVHGFNTVSSNVHTSNFQTRVLTTNPGGSSTRDMIKTISVMQIKAHISSTARLPTDEQAGLFKSTPSPGRTFKTARLPMDGQTGMLTFTLNPGRSSKAAQLPTSTSTLGRQSQTAQPTTDRQAGVLITSSPGKPSLTTQLPTDRQAVVLTSTSNSGNSPETTRERIHADGQVGVLTVTSSPEYICNLTLTLVGDVRKKTSHMIAKIEENLRQTIIFQSSGRIEVMVKSSRVSTKANKLKVTSLVYTVACDDCDLQEDIIQTAVNSALKSLHLLQYPGTVSTRGKTNVLVVVLCSCAVVITGVMVYFVIRKRKNLLLFLKDDKHGIKTDKVTNCMNRDIANREESDMVFENVAYSIIIKKTSDNSVSHV